MTLTQAFWTSIGMLVGLIGGNALGLWWLDRDRRLRCFNRRLFELERDRILERDEITRLRDELECDLMECDCGARTQDVTYEAPVYNSSAWTGR